MDAVPQVTALHCIIHYITTGDVLPWVAIMLLLALA